MQKKIIVEVVLDIDDGKEEGCSIKSVKVDGVKASYNSRMFDGSWYTIFKEERGSKNERFYYELQLMEQTY